MLMDAGAEYQGYASDVTRTFPVSGTFSNEQFQLYAAVLKVQQGVIRACGTFDDSESFPTLDSLYQLSLNLMAQYVCIGLFGMKQPTLVNKFLDIIYPHHIGHWLGMDLHDCSEAKEGLLINEEGKGKSIESTIVGLIVLWETVQYWTPYQILPGMILTVEPGVYIPKRIRDTLYNMYPGAQVTPFIGMGIRIEDNLLIKPQNQGPEVLTASIS